MKRRRLKLLLVAAGAIVLVIVAALWWLSRPVARFDFLEGGKLVEKRTEIGVIVHEYWHLDAEYQDIFTEAAAELARLGFARTGDFGFWDSGPHSAYREAVVGVKIEEGDGCVVVTVTCVRPRWRSLLHLRASRVKRRLSRTPHPNDP